MTKRIFLNNIKQNLRLLSCFQEPFVVILRTKNAPVLNGSISYFIAFLDSGHQWFYTCSRVWNHGFYFHRRTSAQRSEIRRASLIHLRIGRWYGDYGTESLSIYIAVNFIEQNLQHKKREVIQTDNLSFYIQESEITSYHPFRHPYLGSSEAWQECFLLLLQSQLRL